MKRTIAAAALVVIGATGVIQAVRAQDTTATTDPRILAYDKGPKTIDVSKYPPEMKTRYKVFAAKCGKCHTLARPINCDFALADEWERYVKRMMFKSGTFISPDEGKQIFEFLVYDSQTRKKALFDQKTKEAAKGSSEF